MEKYYMGVDIGGTTTKFGLFTDTGQLAKKWSIPTDISKNGRYIISDIHKEIQGILKEQPVIDGIGLGIPGPVCHDGYVESCVNLGWYDINPEKTLAALLKDIPVVSGNDANVAALGECFKGAGTGHENIFMVTLGTGVGGGAVVNGRIVNGFQGLSGEIGHIPVNHTETELCNCGNCGCLDQIASASGIVRYAKTYLQQTEKASMLRNVYPLTAANITQAAASGDKPALEILGYCMGYLGKSLSMVSHIIDPEIFIIGGGVSNAGALLLPFIQKGYDACMFLKRSKADIRIAKLGSDGGIYGAARLAMQEISTNTYKGDKQML